MRNKNEKENREATENIANPQTVKQAIASHYGNYVFDFSGKKWFKFPDLDKEIYETDQYGHFEVELESLLAAEAGVDEDTPLEKAYELIREFLLAHEIEPEDNEV